MDCAFTDVLATLDLAEIMSLLISRKAVLPQEALALKATLGAGGVEGPASDVAKAQAILAAETLVVHRVLKTRPAWKSLFKSLLQELTAEQKFVPEEVAFLVDSVWGDHREAFERSDKTKNAGPFGNKTFWFAITYNFNVAFPTRMRGVVAMRNKLKGLMQYPPACHERRLAVLCASRRAHLSNPSDSVDAAFSPLKLTKRPLRAATQAPAGASGRPSKLAKRAGAKIQPSVHVLPRKPEAPITSGPFSLGVGLGVGASVAPMQLHCMPMLRREESLIAGCAQFGLLDSWEPAVDDDASVTDEELFLAVDLDHFGDIDVDVDVDVDVDMETDFGAHAPCLPVC